MSTTSEATQRKRLPPLPLPATGYVRLAQIIGDPKTGTPGPIPIGKSTWWLGVKEGRFPQPVNLGPRTTAWRAEDIHDLIEKMGREDE